MTQVITPLQIEIGKITSVNPSEVSIETIDGLDKPNLIKLFLLFLNTSRAKFCKDNGINQGNFTQWIGMKKEKNSPISDRKVREYLKSVFFDEKIIKNEVSEKDKDLRNKEVERSGGSLFVERLLQIS